MATKVLVVIDDTFRFATGATPVGDPDFTFETLVSALTSAGFDLTKANRSPDNTATPGFDSFRFDTLPLGRSLQEFDALWLISHDGRNSTDYSGFSTVGGLGASQLTAIANYMDAGGGVFATGDHDSLGANVGGWLPRVRVMRAWYGAGDIASPLYPSGNIPSELVNFSTIDATRADTIHRKTSSETPPSQYPSFGDGVDNYVWFENQSDSFPQPITPIPVGPAHPILRNNGHDITTFPDHMHEGNALGEVSAVAYDYAATLSPFGDTTKLEFRTMSGQPPEKPKVIATGQALAQASRYSFSAANPPPVIAQVATAKQVNTLSIYDGRNVGVGRIVTASTFHHYVDINLTGATAVTGSTLAQTRVGTDGMKGQGLSDNPAVLDDMKAVYVNITNWISRPQQKITLILERSTFSQDEVNVSQNFDGVVLITVDGLKPNQFPNGGIPALGSIPLGATWPPTITPPAGVPITFVPLSVDSDDPSPTLSDRLQRFTITYRVSFTDILNLFNFNGNTSTIPITATLISPAVAPTGLLDTAWFLLVNSANPFMLDLADGNATTWLSSDIKVFHVVEGQTFHGVTLPVGATRTDALNFIHTLASTISSAEFSGLPSTEEASVLSTLPTTFPVPWFGMPQRVYNFALARVRLSNAGSDAHNVRVFFRAFNTMTTAALTYHLDSSQMPVEGYRRTPGPNPIALPGTQNGGADWLSFPFFDTERTSPPETQTDSNNVQDVLASKGYQIYGALIDNNLGDPYLPQTPTSTGPAQPLSSLMMSEHQCLITEIQYDSTPIPDGAMPSTSDKLSQRNLALSPVANPGLDDSRVAIHTFEIEATPLMATADLPPDELMLEWPASTPYGTVVRIHIPTWQAQDVVGLADRIYARHEIAAVDAHTIEIPAGGKRYVPIPMSVTRQNGVISAEFPLGIRKGQRFDLVVRQITNKSRQAKVPPPIVEKLTAGEAYKLLANLRLPPGNNRKGVFSLGENKVLVTDLSVFDDFGDHALVIEYPATAAVAAAMRDSGRWREAIGAFQIGVPVSTKEDMVLHQMRLLSVMRWRTAQLPRWSRWRKTMLHYVDLLGLKVQALGVNPWTIPATPDGAIPQLPTSNGRQCGIASVLCTLLNRPSCLLWLGTILFFVLLMLLILLLRP